MSASARQVRKTVTILFCDLVHSTGLAEGDPEAYRRVQARYFEEMRSVVERHGGTVEKFIGDEVMAVFGIPAVHEDDALRAVRTAQEMLAALRALNDELGASIGLELQARIGVNTGEVLAGDPAGGHGFLAGEPVIIAKRLEQAAEAGEILIGKATYPLVANAVKAGPLERIPVKGKQTGVGRRRVHEVDRDAPGFARRLHAPIVGRDNELALLRTAFERTVEERSCRLFTVLGSAGIGKSRLAVELMSSLEDRATTAVGRCLPYGEGITFWPLTDVLREIGGEPVLEAALAADEQRETVLELVRGATGGSGATGSSAETFWAVRRAFEALAHQRPLVICFEDVHWAEPTLLDLVEYLVGWSRDAPILVLALARPEVVEQRPSWIAPQPNSDAIALEPLSSDDVESLLTELAAEISLSTEVRERIRAAAEGNPLFLEQISALAADQTGEGELPVPPTIQALLAERLDRLSPDEREVIEKAAVVGRDFPEAALAALAANGRQTSVTTHLLGLVRKGLIRPDPSPAAGGDRFSFHHVLVRDAAYEAIPKAVRAELHERCADWLEHRPGEVAQYDEILGYHLEQAYRARAAIAPPDERSERLAVRAGRSLAAAGRRADTRYDVPAAVSFFERAAALLPKDDPERLELLVDLGSVFMKAGSFAEVDPVLSEARVRAEAAGERQIELRAQIEEAFLRSFTEPAFECKELLPIGKSIIHELEKLGDDCGLAKAWHLVGDAHVTACHWGERAEALEQALEHARRTTDRRLQGSLTDILGQALLYGPTPVEEALTQCRGFLQEVPGDRTVEAGVLTSIGGLLAMRGEFDDARRSLARAFATYEELGLRFRRAGRSLAAANVELLADEPAAAVRALREGYDLCVAMGEQGLRATLAAYVAEALYVCGKFDESREFSEICEELSAEDDLVNQVVFRCARAKVLAQRGEHEHAEELMVEATEHVAETDFPDLKGTALLSHGEVLRLADRAEEAASLVQGARLVFERKGNVVAARKAEALLSEPVADKDAQAR